MPYTLVPVPSEYVLDVMRWVLFRAPDEDGQTTGRDEARVVQLLDELDDFSRALVVLDREVRGEGRLADVARCRRELGQPPQAVSDALRVINLQALWGKDIVLCGPSPPSESAARTARPRSLSCDPTSPASCGPPRGRRVCQASEHGRLVVPRYFFIHVMKTGGTALATNVSKNFTVDEVYPHPDLDLADHGSDNVRLRAVTIDYLRSLPEERREPSGCTRRHFPFVTCECSAAASAR